MTTISDVLARDDRAKRNIKLATQALSDAFEEGRSEGYAEALATHECPDVESHSRVQAWNTIAVHPFFADCYSTDGTLVDAMVAKLDTAHTHTCEPAWRPVSRDEIQPGWEVRSRLPDGSEAAWGTAHHQDDHGEWRTKADDTLTYDSPDWSWTYETTAPLPEPEPWDEALVGVVSGALAGTEGPAHHWDDDARRVLDALAARGYYLDRPKAGA